MNKLLFSAGLIALMIPSYMTAQRGGYGYGHDRDRERPGERISRVIADCEQRTDQFQVSLRRALERSGLRDSQREDELNRDAAKLEHQLNRVRESWNEARDARRTREHVNRAIEVSRDINRTMVRRRLNPDVQRQWDVVRAELNRLAEVFELPRIGW